MERAERASWPRRKVLAFLAGMGTATVFSRALVTLARDRSAVTTRMIRQAEWITGVGLEPGERELMLGGVNELIADFDAVREVELDNAVAPALMFRPEPDPAPGSAQLVRVRPGAPDVAERPSSDEDLAFLPVTDLAHLLRTGRVTSTELTGLYLDRLARYDERLECVITLLETRALEQAERADREIAAGRYRGVLHGIPWGAKDLLAVPGYRTTWGATPYQDQTRQELATVAARLDEAGAVLVAKLTLGALAWGDVWFGGKTRNPWNPEQGSSGSSAGSAAATSAGLVAFAIGTETWGSIVSPCTRCGVTGLRPTFGRVSRHGAMALSWSMDKIGPIARTVEDCALVFAAIQGQDGHDLSVVDRPFAWPLEGDVRRLRVGFLKDLFEEDRGAEIDDDEQAARAREWQEFDRQSLAVLRDLGFSLVPLELSDRYPVQHLSYILSAEAAAAFDDLTRGSDDDRLVRQVEQAWPNVLRQAQLIPAVEYLRANRVRTLVLAELEETLADIDVWISPSYGGDNLLRTNLTGHPCVVVPNGFRRGDGTPTSLTFQGRLHGETAMLAVAQAYQQATGFHRKRPPLEEES